MAFHSKGGVRKTERSLIEIVPIAYLEFHLFVGIVVPGQDHGYHGYTGHARVVAESVPPKLQKAE